MSNRGAVVASFLAGVILVALAVVAYGPAGAGMSLAEKKAALRQAVTQQLDTIKFGAQEVGNTGAEEGNEGAAWNTHVVRTQNFAHCTALPATRHSLAIKTDVHHTGCTSKMYILFTASLHLPFSALCKFTVCALQNFAGNNQNAVARGWKSGANTEHGGFNVGMFGQWGVDNVDLAHPAPAAECPAKCSNAETADLSCCDVVWGLPHNADQVLARANCKDLQEWKNANFVCTCQYHHDIAGGRDMREAMMASFACKSS
jgi:hypothetical protein